MFATTSELKATASAGLVVRVNKVRITLATRDLDKTLLAIYLLEWILFQFHKLAPSLVKALERNLEVNWLLRALGYVGYDFITIKQVDMIGLEV